MFDEKVVYITGAAHGIGRMIAKAFASKGASVVIADVDPTRGEAVVNKIIHDGGNAIFVKTDLSIEAQIKNSIDVTKNKFGRLDIVINNARPKLRCGLFEDNMDEWDLAMDVMLKAPALTVKYALPYLKEVKKGSIINISSTNAFFVSHQSAAYHVAKSGVLQLTKYLAYKFGKYGIRANAICPALVDLHDECNPLTSNPKYKKITETIVPLGRAASAEEIAEMTLFLCSEKASYMTGQVLTLDGGLTVGDHFNNATKFLN